MASDDPGIGTKSQLRENLALRSSQIISNISGLAVLMGASISIGLLATGLKLGLLSPNSAVTTPRILFIGCASGHYIGISQKKENNTVSSGYIGGYGVVFIGALAVKPEFYSAIILLAMSLGFFLGHYTNFFEHYGAIDDFLESVSDYSPIGLILLAMLETVTSWPIEVVVNFPNSEATKLMLLGTGFLAFLGIWAWWSVFTSLDH